MVKFSRLCRKYGTHLTAWGLYIIYQIYFIIYCIACWNTFPNSDLDQDRIRIRNTPLTTVCSGTGILYCSTRPYFGGKKNWKNLYNWKNWKKPCASICTYNVTLIKGSKHYINGEKMVDFRPEMLWSQICMKFSRVARDREQIYLWFIPPGPEWSPGTCCLKVYTVTWPVSDCSCHNILGEMGGGGGVGTGIDFTPLLRFRC